MRFISFKRFGENVFKSLINHYESMKTILSYLLHSLFNINVENARFLVVLEGDMEVKDFQKNFSIILFNVNLVV